MIHKRIFPDTFITAAYRSSRFAARSCGLLDGRRPRRVKEQSRIHVGKGFTPDVFHPFAVPPPTLIIIIWVRHCDDPDLHVLSERLLKEQASPARMCVLRDEVDALHG